MQKKNKKKKSTTLHSNLRKFAQKKTSHNQQTDKLGFNHLHKLLSIHVIINQENTLKIWKTQTLKRYFFCNIYIIIIFNMQVTMLYHSISRSALSRVCAKCSTALNARHVGWPHYDNDLQRYGYLPKWGVSDPFRYFCRVKHNKARVKDISRSYLCHRKLFRHCQNHYFFFFGYCQLNTIPVSVNNLNPTH